MGNSSSYGKITMELVNGNDILFANQKVEGIVFVEQ